MNFLLNPFKDAAITSPLEFLISKPSPTVEDTLDYEIAMFSLKDDSRGGSDHLVNKLPEVNISLLLISMNSNM